MEELISNLQSIKEFRVLGRNSIEQYRNNTTKSNPDIAKELGVTYIIEGSGKRYGNTFNLRVRLIKAKGKETQIWTKLYEREVKETEDIVSIPNQIVQAIASELNAAISPEEKQIIEKTPTTSLSAYDFYWKGKEEYLKYYNDNENRDALERAEILYNKALEYDSDFALAYVGLATVYRSKHYWETFFSDKFLDSTLILTNKALSIDNKLAEAYTIKGAYYRDMGKPDLAVKEIDKAIKLNPNDWTSYLIKAQNSGGDLVMGIENYLKVISLNRSSELPTYLRSISQLYLDAGFIEKAKEYLLEAVELDGDSLIYLYNLGAINTWSGNHSIGLEYALKVYVLDSTHLDNLHLLGHTYMFLGKYYESLKYFKKYIDRLQANGSLNLLDMESLGYAYWQTGNKRVAESYFNREIDYCNKAIELGRSFGNDGAYYELAAIYAVLGENEKVMKNLRIYCERQSFTSMYIQLLLNDPMFNTIRNLPEFKQIVNEAEAKYQIVHEKVRKWLDENNML
jgi:tetratricopeptide (TPR) repeat protein